MTAELIEPQAVRYEVGKYYRGHLGWFVVRRLTPGEITIQNVSGQFRGRQTSWTHAQFAWFQVLEVGGRAAPPAIVRAERAGRRRNNHQRPRRGASQHVNDDHEALFDDADPYGELSDRYLDGSRDFGYYAREDGRYGSYPVYDDYSDESDP